eukprot:4422554-Pleurochrysis_carterae.AAC.1
MLRMCSADVSSEDEHMYPVKTVFAIRSAKHTLSGKSGRVTRLGSNFGPTSAAASSRLRRCMRFMRLKRFSACWIVSTLTVRESHVRRRQ